jgi:hypothetical protein
MYTRWHQIETVAPSRESEVYIHRLAASPPGRDRKWSGGKILSPRQAIKESRQETRIGSGRASP